ncbi:MAG: glycosyltransferase family 39 protein [Parvularculaceae bacterium]
MDGRVYSQYPPGYALIAAPFYLFGGLTGLFLLNAVCGLAAIWLVRDIAARLYRDDAIALLAAGLFTFCTFFLTYAFAIWPHVLTIAMLLGAADLAIRSAENGRVSFWRLAVAGALIAAATNVRVDSVLFLAPVFIWLRLVAAPGDRIAPIVFLVGGVPFYGLAAWFNYLKYGIASPITYGAPTEYETLGDYTPLAVLAVLGAAALMVVDARSRARCYARPSRARRGGRARNCGPLRIRFFHRQIFTLAHNFWTLFFDIQAYDGNYFHDIMTPDAKGYLTMYGFPKKAFLQSMPFLSPPWSARPSCCAGETCARRHLFPVRRGADRFLHL